MATLDTVREGLDARSQQSEKSTQKPVNNGMGDVALSRDVS